MVPDVLPDSRLASPRGAVVVDWPLPDGTTARLEAVPVYCANCGKPYGWVPRDNTNFAFWLCRPCFEKYGEIAGTYAMPDDWFNEAVAHEMQARFGRTLTAEEVARLSAEGRLGRPLELLARESPYPTPGG